MKRPSRKKQREARAHSPLSAREFPRANIEVRRHKSVSAPISVAAFNIMSNVSGGRPAATAGIGPASETEARSDFSVTFHA